VKSDRTPFATDIRDKDGLDDRRVISGIEKQLR
jgi:hypothetical protein